MAINVMQRYEMKYLLSDRQTDFLRERLEGNMQADGYGKTSIASLYYDTENYRLIRASEEKPPFKEKIRLRSYGLATDASPVFLELKRKAFGVVYKRRIETTIPQVERFFSGEDGLFDGQISREITTFRDYYKTLAPSCLIIYDRTAYFEPDGDLRLTIDENPRFRTDHLTLTKSMDGISLLRPGWTVLEVKVQEAMPLWLAETLSQGGIMKASFSKYGEAFRRQLLAVQNY
ncbi:MAG: polyphosphate polymerase domain-containing protein [Clostridia bacterium]|nr:polyphosphate polymerase domain-containing protein [Clostridia bacterium]